MGQVKEGQVKVGQVKEGQVKEGQVKVGQVKVGQVRLTVGRCQNYNKIDWSYAVAMTLGSPESPQPNADSLVKL